MTQNEKKKTKEKKERKKSGRFSFKPPFRKSIGAQLTFMVLLIVASSLVIIGIVNAFFLVPFYTRNKEKRLMEAYREISTEADTAKEAESGDESGSDSDADSDSSISLSDDLIELSMKDNIVITLTDSDLRTFQTTGRNGTSIAARLFGYYTGFYVDPVKVVKKTDDYTIQETTDKRISTTYLEMWGQLKNGQFFLMQTPLESIESAARLSSMFYVWIGIIVMAAAGVVSWILMKRYTRPIRQLNDLSKKMAGLDFEARYEGQTEDEIGQLGESFNKMSAELERTISELKTANAELQRDNERKTQIDEVRTEFLNNVTHELKTPIALIQGYAEGLKDNIAEDEESRNFYADVIIDESAKMNNMVKQLLTLNRLEFGNDVVEMERFDLTQLIAGVIKGMQVMIDENNAHVSFPYKDPVYVWGDEFKIEEVVTNYLSNACHHVDGERKIEVTMVPENEDTIRITVFNTGEQIPEDSLGRVFEKFYKVDKARTRAYGGSGIGLSIVKAIMDGHHQKYGVENRENGVAFYFTMDTGNQPKVQPESEE